MQNLIQKFRQSSLIFEKPDFLSEKLKTLTSSNYHKVQYFLLKFCTHFLLTIVYKRVFGIIIFLFRSWVICENQKDLLSTHQFFTFLLITQHQFFRRITWFLGNNRALPKFRYRILHNLISIIKLKKKISS